MPGLPTRRRRPLLSSHVLLPALLLVLLGLVITVQGHAVHEEHACPDHAHAHGSPEDAHHSHHHHDSPASPSSPPEGASGLWLHQHLPTGEWAKAFGATAIISIFPTLLLPFIPLTRSVNGVAALNEGVHKLLLSFAAGGLLGEVFLHSLPHLLEHHDHFSSSSSSSSSHQHHQHDGSEEEAAHDNRHKHSHAHGGGGVRLEEGEVMRICLNILAGFLLFFVTEKAVTVVLGDEGGHSHSHGHGHAHTHKSKSGASVSEDEEGEEEEVDEEEEEGEEEDFQGVGRRSPRIRERYSGPERRQIATAAAAAAAGGRNNTGGLHRRKLASPSSPKKQQQQQQQRQITTAAAEEEGGEMSGLKASGYLNIVVDVLHNLTDGIAIGASFASGQGVGVATTLSVFLHECPHEIGDLAILVQSGLSVRNAFLMQFFTAIAAFLGTFLGLVAKRQEGLERILLALTTGGFLYVACVSVLPELLSGGGKGGGGQAVREVGGVLAGIGLMAWVAVGEHGHDH